MTVTSLLTALAAGLLIGVVGYWVGRTTRLVPIWLPPAVGIGAALLATVVARLAGIDSLRVSPVEVGLQLGLATIAVAATISTIDQRRTSDRYDRTVSTR